MSNDFSDFNVDDMYYGLDEDESSKPIGASDEDKKSSAKGDGANVPKETKSRRGGGADSAPTQSSQTSKGENGKPSKADRAKTLAQLMLIILLLAFNAAQLMGIAYHGTLNKGWESSSVDKVFANIAGVTAGTSKEAPKTAAVKKPPEPAPTQAQQAAATKEEAKTTAPTPAVGKPLAKTSPPVAEAPKKAAPPATPTGTHAVSVGIFRSQKHVLKMKRDLDKLSLPYFMQRSEKKGEGYVTRISGNNAKTLDAAKAALTAGGYDYKESDAALTAYFHYDYEAAKALALAKKAGASGAVQNVSGNLPVWKLLVGPFSSGNANKAAKKLSSAKIDNYVLRLSK